MPNNNIRTRFAPSPTGYMHVGNLRTALYTWLIARHSGGKFILRIEDTDQGRLVEGATEVIYATLRKCGLTWDEGPDIGGPVGPYIQTERRALYGKYAELLVEKGHAYYCFCEKTESEEDSGNFDRAADPCRDMSLEEARAKVAAGAPYVIRQLGQGKELPLGVLASGRPAQQGDVVDHRLGQIAHGDEILVGGVALALAHLVVGVPHDGGAVDIGGYVPAEALVQQIVLGGGGQVLGTPHHVGDAHQVIVDDVGKVVGE